MKQRRFFTFSLASFLSFSLTAFICVCVLLATDRRAYAYVDPGSGLLALQSLASILAAAGFFLRRHIRALFGGKKQAQAEPLQMPVADQEASTREAA